MIRSGLVRRIITDPAGYGSQEKLTPGVADEEGIWANLPVISRLSLRKLGGA